jgi:hypothetical protein
MERSLRYPGNWHLTPAQVGQLELFSERAEELSDYGIQGYPFASEIRMTSSECDVKAELPDETKLRSAAIAARLFYMNDEPTHFFKVCGLLWQAAQDCRFKDEVASCRKTFSDFRREGISGAAVLKDGRQINAKGQLLDAFFNGGYFHSDETLREFVRRCDSGLGVFFKQRFAQCLHEMSSYVWRLNQVVDNALGIDQLATTSEARGIQSVLTSFGYDRTLINVWWNPKTSTVNSEFMDLRMKEETSSAVLGKVLQLLREAYPEAKYFILDYRNGEGELRGIAWPELPQRPLL